MRESDLLSEIDPSLTSLILKVRLYDDYESSLPLESNFVDNAPLPDLEELYDSPLTSLPFVALSSSSTLIATSVSDLTLVVSALPFPLPLTQCMELEMGRHSRGDVSVIEDGSLDQLIKLCLVEPYLEETPFEEFCGDVVVGSAVRSIGLIDSICIVLFDLT